MDELALERPGDEEDLRAQLRRYEALLAERDAQLERREQTIEQLREQINVLLAKRYGASSEKVAEAQLGLFNEAELEAALADDAQEEATPTSEVAAHRRARPKRTPLPEHLPRIDIEHPLPQAERLCPHHGVALERFGEETSEQLDIVPAKIRVLRHIRGKYRCPCCTGHLRTAPMPPQPIPKSNASPGLLAYIATAKFVDGLALYHQERQFARIGFEVSRTTLATWMIRSGELLQPLVNLLRDELLARRYLLMDETTVQVLKEAGKAAQSKSYLWAQRSADGAPIVLFEYDPTRSSQVPKRLLEGFTGTLHTDGYPGYDAVVAELGLVRLYCWVHARRRFVEVLKSLGLNPKKLPTKPPPKARRALKAIGFIKTLYAIERRIAEKPPDERLRVRQAESLPVLAQLRAWLDETRPKIAPSSKLGDALAYLDAHWAGLVRYCDDGRYVMDTNLVENAIRPFCIGRRRWLFCDTVAGAKSSANLYSLIETAKANGLEPHAYLRHVFTELPTASSVDDIERLLPMRIDPARLRPDAA
jgi:transposase